MRHIPLASHIAKKGADILNELDGQREQVTKSRRTVTFKFFRGVDGSLTERMMEKLTLYAQTSFYLRHSSTYRIRNLEDGRAMLVSKDVSSSTRMNRLQQAHNWISKQEKVRLTTDNIDRPNTKWVFVRFIQVQLSIVQTREALLGTGSLPEWLRRKKGLVALDT